MADDLKHLSPVLVLNSHSIFTLPLPPHKHVLGLYLEAEPVLIQYLPFSQVLWSVCPRIDCFADPFTILASFSPRLSPCFQPQKSYPKVLSPEKKSHHGFQIGAVRILNKAKKKKYFVSKLTGGLKSNAVCGFFFFFFFFLIQHYAVIHKISMFLCSLHIATG